MFLVPYLCLLVSTARGSSEAAGRTSPGSSPPAARPFSVESPRRFADVVRPRRVLVGAARDGAMSPRGATERGRAVVRVMSLVCAEQAGVAIPDS